MEGCWFVNIWLLNNILIIVYNRTNYETLKEGTNIQSFKQKCILYNINSSRCLTESNLCYTPRTNDLLRNYLLEELLIHLHREILHCLLKIHSDSI